MGQRIAICVLIGVASGALCWCALHNGHQGAADFQWPMRLAHNMLAGNAPYDTPLQRYPGVAAVFALPFLWLPPEAAAGAFFGISSALLAFGLTRHSYRRLLIFLAFPYWASLITAQWSPLIAASFFFPVLLPVTIVKPQVGVPVFLTRCTRTGVVACLVVGLASLALSPRWPLLWVRQWGYHEHFYALLIFPGLLVLLALLRWRDSDSWLLLLSALMPQRWFYDIFVLWVIPKTRREIVWTSFLSWGCGFWRWYYPPTSFAQVGRWTVLLIYLPMLIVILLRAYAAERGSIVKAQAAAS